MKLLVVSATAFEIKPFVHNYPKGDVLITGVGVPAAMFSLTKVLLTGQFDFAIQAGIAGSFSPEQITKVFAVAKDTFADIGFYDNGDFKTVFDYGFANANEPPFKNGWLHAEYFADLQKATAVTVNKVTNNDSDINIIRQKFNPDIESMEGAAFHYACLQSGVPFLQLRAVSNLVGDRDKYNWRTKEAVTNLNEVLSDTYKKYLGI